MKSIFSPFKSTFFLTFIIYFIQSFNCQILAQSSLNYYFGQGISFNPEIPTPEEILGYQIGDFHVNHDHLTRYLLVLAERSERVNIIQYGTSYERRPLFLLTISSIENIKNIDAIREDHIGLSDASISSSKVIENMPVVIWLGYNVHGNEASGANASLLTAYYLAAATGKEIEKILDNVIVLIDPCINPDGFNRFSEWINTNRSKNLITDPNNREHNEPWPGGRTNHYWFDLNRDWLLAQHPESQGRLEQFHKWKPNILTDHHEMGSNATFFFQPGIPSRNNPNTPAKTHELTEAIARYHSKELDNIGSLYYSKESFDDYYYGKGSSYPDVNGSVGILFEQASSRSHARESVNGILEFKFTIRNQLKTSISTLKAGYEIKNELLEHQRNFYQSALDEASANPYKAWIFNKSPGDYRMVNFLQLLKRHRIKVFEFSGSISSNGQIFTGNNSYVVPFSQHQYRLINAVFEKRTTFEDSLFYDVSAWTIPLAFDIDFCSVTDRQYKSIVLGEEISYEETATTSIRKSDYGYVFGWDDFLAPKALFFLQSHGVTTKVNLKSYTINGKEIKPGGIFIPIGIQKIGTDSIYNLIKKSASMISTAMIPVESSWTDQGIQLGSPNMVNLPKPEIALLVGNGIHSNEAGEVWHLFDQRYSIPITLLSNRSLDNVDLNRYNTIIMVSGSYREIDDNGKKDLKIWVENGGKIVAFKSAIKWLNNQKIVQLTWRKSKPDTLMDSRDYSDLQKYRGAQLVSGTILESRIDLTHPINFGLNDTFLPIFKNDNSCIEIPANPYNRPVMITNSPLLSGYISDENINLLKNSPAVMTLKSGKGRVLAFNFNPNFRAYWFGTNRLFVNAVFFGSLISSRAAD